MNDFRKMWADADEQETKRMISEAQKVVEASSKVSHSTPSSIHTLSPSNVHASYQPRPSPLVGNNLPEFQTFIDDLQRWVRACQDGTVFCVRGLVQGVRSVFKAVSSLFERSGKESPMWHEF